MDPTAVEQKHKFKCAVSGPVQLMVGGHLGPAGVPVPCLVEEVPDREQGTALTLTPNMGGENVKGVTSRVIFAIMTIVQPMVTGVLGVPGERAAGRAVEGKCGGTVRAMTLVPSMEEELVRGRTPSCRGATLTGVLWMEAGETGRVGAIALCLVEEAKRLGNGYVTTQCHLKVAVPVEEMLLRYPGAVHKHVQVGPIEPEEVLLEILMMLNLELLSLTPQ